MPTPPGYLAFAYASPAGTRSPAAFWLVSLGRPVITSLTMTSRASISNPALTYFSPCRHSKRGLGESDIDQDQFQSLVRKPGMAPA